MAHFESPRNVGEIPSPERSSRARNPVCGDEVRATFRVREGRIVEMRYRALGCHVTVAVMSALSEKVRDEPVEAARRLTAGDIAAWFDDFPSGRRHAADLGVEILRGAFGPGGAGPGAGE